MSRFKSFLGGCALFLIALQAGAQAVSPLLTTPDVPTDTPQCGHAHFGSACTEAHASYPQHADGIMEQLQRIVSRKKAERTASVVYQIPVVFHVVHNNEDENLADEVILDQLDILNAAFRRTNADAEDTREVFQDVVGDAEIEFYLADTDPDGLPTNGIVKVETDVEYFGGILPYNASQTAEIQAWVAEEFYPNLWRLTQSEQGGSDPWNTDEYLNIWIGDLRILEPELGDFEELVFFGLATPPFDFENWPPELTEFFDGFHQGVLVHYVNVGSNNPNTLPVPYNTLNNATNDGKITVHEVGHYLGLRHIWGDGGCTMDDFVADTPKMAASSTWNCNTTANTCADDYDGDDWPDMIENYMDYASGDCQNAFTLGQADIMRAVIEEFRPGLIGGTVALEEAPQYAAGVRIYPNPFEGAFCVELPQDAAGVTLTLVDARGNTVWTQQVAGQRRVRVAGTFSSGVYLLQVLDAHGRMGVHRVIK